MAKPSRAVRGKTNRKRKRNPWLRVLSWLGIGILALSLIGVGVVAVAYTNTKLPDPNSDFRTQTTFVYYNDGKSLLGSFSVQNRVVVPYGEMNPYIKDAIVAAENRTFWTDPGFDVGALARAVKSLIGPEQTVGGSTLTQQYIKVMYLTQEKTLSRKAEELLLAAKVGQYQPKQEILAGYLNTVYFGRGAYGIEAASQAYFRKPQAKLDLAQSVALACIANSPNNLDPGNGDKQAADLLERYQYALNGMVEMGVLTQAERSDIYYQLPKFPDEKKSSALGGPKGFLLDMVKSELLANGFTDAMIAGGGYKITTTFDKKAQAAAVKSAQAHALEAAGGSKKKAADIHVGLASLDNATGGVLALYGGADHNQNYLNWAMTRRPTGSTFKPYALAAGLRDGWTLSDRVNGHSVTPPGESRPVTEGYPSSISLLYATTKSVNPAFVDLVVQLKDGHDKVVKAAEDAGVPHDPSWDSTGYRIPLGTGEISPLSQAEGYSTFANGGQHVDWHVVEKVTTANDETLYATQVDPQQTIEADVAKDVTYALTTVAQDGTGYRAARLGYPVAGKTGTFYNPELRATQSTWFVGFTKQITTAVMFVKGDKGTGNLGQSVYGSGWPTSTWLDYMKVAMDGKERLSFAGPTNRRSTQSPSPEPSETPTATPTPSETATLPSESPSALPSDPATSPPPTGVAPTSAPVTDPTSPAPAPPAKPTQSVKPVPPRKSDPPAAATTSAPVNP